LIAVKPEPKLATALGDVVEIPAATDVVATEVCPPFAAKFQVASDVCACDTLVKTRLIRMSVKTFPELRVLTHCNNWFRFFIGELMVC
jgi:hypothetical protein